MASPSETPTTDTIIRGTAANGMIRALAINATETVRDAQRTHGLSPLATAALGRLLMASQIMGSLFKDSGEKLSLMIRCTGDLGGLTAIAESDGTVKGYAENPDAPCSSPAPTANDVAAGLGQGTLAVVRTSPHIEPFVSQISLVNGTISDDLIAYYIMSEQIPTIVSLDVVFANDGQVECAGGYFIQLMPDYDDELLANLEASISAAPPVSSMLAEGLSPQAQVETVLAGENFKLYESLPTGFRCDCSRQRSEETLLSLGASELASLIAEGEPVDIKCDYCGTHYQFTSEEIQQLITANPPDNS